MNKQIATDTHIAGIADQILNDNYNGYSMSDVTEAIYNKEMDATFNALLAGVVNDEAVISRTAIIMLKTMLDEEAKILATSIAKKEFDEA